jgi:NADPH-dependent 2,4-dienoyl-CoA reductase/sulfur reductase-like enzyme
VDEFMQASQPDIFAAGDVAEVFDPLNGRYVLHTLWGQARQEGHAAGLNMAGVSTPYCSGIAFNVTRLAGLTTTLIGALGRGDDVDLVGVARGDSETWRQLPDAIAAENHFEINRLRLLLGETTLLGAVVMGDQTLSQPLQRLIAANADITPIRQRLLQPGARLGDLIVSFYEHWMKEYAQSAAPRPT